MEYSITLHDIDDARDMFLLAKDRLLDVNDWNNLYKSNDYSFLLTKPNGSKLHRDARIDDRIKISATNNNGNSSDMWVRIDKIQYDFFPDVNSESISMLLEMSYSPSGDGVDTPNRPVESIVLKREHNSLTAHCNIGNELPALEDKTPNEQINTKTDLHPILSIPNEQLEQLLQGLIAVYEYKAA